ncbi:signal peptidase complex subunit 1 [Stylonychia lemnae]|uniref:Signal peptidase complex subunit 1 n=1 Tax=Stylonychia lemnae TaxID=5949 RepID=A0A077ZXC8_STYLE|nr:signal peptidase complex subunit 1 [Stylonychia lemnae]|eukprot:CDW74555.1 signal peptidase complex subunit 1 [Stylonychia lemnae]
MDKSGSKNHLMNQYSTNTQSHFNSHQTHTINSKIILKSSTHEEFNYDEFEKTLVGVSSPAQHNPEPQIIYDNQTYKIPSEALVSVKKLHLNDVPIKKMKPIMLHRQKTQNSNALANNNNTSASDYIAQTTKSEQQQPLVKGTPVVVKNAGSVTKASQTGSFQYYFQISPVEDHSNRMSFIKNKIMLLNKVNQQKNLQRLVNRQELQFQQQQQVNPGMGNGFLEYNQLDAKEAGGIDGQVAQAYMMMSGTQSSLIHSIKDQDFMKNLLDRKRSSGRNIYNNTVGSMFQNYQSNQGNLTSRTVISGGSKINLNQQLSNEKNLLPNIFVMEKAGNATTNTSSRNYAPGQISQKTPQKIALNGTGGLNTSIYNLTQVNSHGRVRSQLNMRDGGAEYAGTSSYIDSSLRKKRNIDLFNDLEIIVGGNSVKEAKGISRQAVYSSDVKQINQQGGKLTGIGNNILKPTLVTKVQKQQFVKLEELRAKSLASQQNRGLYSFTKSEAFKSQQEMVKSDLRKIQRDEYSNKIYNTTSNLAMLNKDGILSIEDDGGLDLNISQESLDDIKKIRQDLLRSERKDSCMDNDDDKLDFNEDFLRGSIKQCKLNKGENQGSTQVKSPQNQTKFGLAAANVASQQVMIKKKKQKKHNCDRSYDYKKDIIVPLIIQQLFNKMEHPATKEGFTDRIYRNVNEMDFEGQKLAEKIMRNVMILSAVIGFGIGYVNEKFSHTVYIMLGSMFLLFLITGPALPIYKKNELQWRSHEISAEVVDKKQK